MGEDGQCLQKGIHGGIEFVVFCWYILWDLSVLTAYIRKINELIKNSKATQHFQRIKKVLGKIIILTLLYELSFVFYFGITRLEEINLFGDFVKETKIAACIDLFITMIILYLMLEHNDEKYLKLQHILKKSRVCCCCKRYLYFPPLRNVQKKKEKKEETTIAVEVTTTSDLEIEMDAKNKTHETSETAEIKNNEIELTKSQISDLEMTIKKQIDSSIQIQSEYDPERTTTEDLEREAAVNKKQIAAMRNGKYKISSLNIYYCIAVCYILY